jgi:hypothetical protein
LLEEADVKIPWMASFSKPPENIKTRRMDIDLEF